MEGGGKAQAMAGKIFTDMVMDQAIQDKEAEINEEMKVDEFGGTEAKRKESMDSDEDFNLEDD